MNTSLYDAFASAVNTITMPAPRIILSIVAGVLLGMLVSQLIFVLTKRTIVDSICSGLLDYTLIQAKKTANPSDQSIDNEKAQELLDEVGNTIADIGSGFSYGSFYVIIIASGCTCYCLLGWIGAIPFIASYILSSFLAPKLEERRLILSRIEEIVIRSKGDTKEAKKIAREFYKTFRAWLKPGRTREEYFRDASIVLQEYLDQINP